MHLPGTLGLPKQLGGLGVVWLNGNGEVGWGRLRERLRAQNAKAFTVWKSKLKESNGGSVVQLLCVTFSGPTWIQNETGHLWVSPRQISFHYPHSAVRQAPHGCHCQKAGLDSMSTSILGSRKWESPLGAHSLETGQTTKGKVNWVFSPFWTLWLSILTKKQSHWLTNIQSLRQTRSPTQIFRTS
jgi:hypothetical protein